MATLPPSYHTLLSETATTFAVFPSWMYIPDGDDNYILSVPCNTSDLHFGCWQSGANCQAMVADAFLRFSATHCGFLALSLCLAHALSALRFPSFRPDNASFRSCLLLPPGFLGTRDPGIFAGSRAWSSSSSSSFSSISSARDGMCPVVSSSQREISSVVEL